MNEPPAGEPEPLTERQLEIYRWIWDFTLSHGYQPSVREITEHFEMRSPNGTTVHLKALVRKGWIGPSNLESRAIRFLRTPDGKGFTGFAEPSK